MNKIKFNNTELLKSVDPAIINLKLNHTFQKRKVASSSSNFQLAFQICVPLGSLSKNQPFEMASKKPSSSTFWKPNAKSPDGDAQKELSSPAMWEEPKEMFLVIKQHILSLDITVDDLSSALFMQLLNPQAPLPEDEYEPILEQIFEAFQICVPLGSLSKNQPFEMASKKPSSSTFWKPNAKSPDGDAQKELSSPAMWEEPKDMFLQV
ncbi:uncharacterized protein G2W53_034753 [Senna tora]|uniref:Uncharacterized protein n=1 Tax=Senna tora TaxID=362788 RepID=A0A834T2D2_9FABA|nr:uncharacterized protein G2W53_034753 [Senna tora]